MIRVLFWLVLFINLVFFALMKWGGALMHEEGGVLNQASLNAEKIRIVPASAVAAASAIVAPASAPLPAPVPTPTSAASAAAPTLAPSQPAAAATVGATTSSAACVEWGEFSGSDLSHATANLATLKLGEKLSQRQVEHSTGYWVYIPPLKTRAEINQKVAQLKKLGVKQYFIVQETGKWHNAISLGVFKSSDLAQKFLAQLKTKGVRSAAAGERNIKLKFTVFALKNPDAATLSKLTTWQKDYTGIEMRSVSCN